MSLKQKKTLKFKTKDKIEPRHKYTLQWKSQTCSQGKLH